jgi:flavin-dependent dehydrogenase
VLIVEREERFSRKVGEATVEISSFFLHRVLGLYDYLSRHQLPKHGLRYWFADRADRPLAEMSETGPFDVPRLPAFLLDRSRLDEHLLSLAAAAGAEVARPARVEAVEEGWPESRVRIATEAGERQVTARWVVDASGRHAFLARRKRLRRRTEELPTAAAWARWKGVRDFDGPSVMGPDPRHPGLTDLPVSRRLATNHFGGYGYWCWMIPLPGGETSVGVVYDKELFQLPGDGTLRERYESFVTGHPGMAELLDGAEIDADDFLAYGHLPYTTRRYMGRGWALVGDAASFIDPFYSPGLDHASNSVYATARWIEDDLSGRLDDAALDDAIRGHNEAFERSYRRWLEALYVGKYELMGDAELLSCAFLFDTALYYLGIVTPLYKNVDEMRRPLVFGHEKGPAKWVYRSMRTFHRRLITLARKRRAAGVYGRRNAGQRIYARAFDLGPAAAVGPLFRVFRIWLRIELECLGHRLRHGRADVSRPVAVAER